jgi:PiT family inorganic phosphate transporter
MTLLVIIIVLALVFDYINGFHDAANSIATIVSTKVLSPFQAVIWAAAFNFIAYFIFSDHHVANTVAKTVHEEFITLRVVLAGLLAAISWNLLTWWYGIPSSSSHTLIGGFAGAALAGAGFDLDSINIGKIAHHCGVHLPRAVGGHAHFHLHHLGHLGAEALVTLDLDRRRCTAITSIFVLKNNESTHRTRGLRTDLHGSVCVGHDAYPQRCAHGQSLQETPVAQFCGLQHRTRWQRRAEGDGHHHGGLGRQWKEGKPGPIWMLGCHLACYTAIGLGTLSGGWKIVKTMGTRITKVTPLEGVCAESAGAMTLYMTEQLGIPVSTTHTITGAIIGVGATKRLSAVRWGVTVKLLWAWVLTIPVSAVLAAIAYWICGFFIE